MSLSIAERAGTRVDYVLPPSPAPVPGAAPKLIALVDCESFFASCERVFHPELAARPIVVLSNNDGCIVALNKEAKAVGMKMGTPWFQVRHAAETAGVVARSSNYELYGSLSNRVMRIIGEFSCEQEVYSIDESFISLTGSPAELRELGLRLRARVAQLTGLPVRVSIAATKTLAKVAALGAKADRSLSGVCSLGEYSAERLDEIFSEVPVAEVWGVGRRIAKRLAASGVKTVQQLREVDVAWAHKRFSVNLARTVLELRGVPCVELDQQPPAAKEQLIFSRSFARPVSDPAEMRAVLSVYAQRVSGRLRAAGQLASLVTAWCATAYYKEGYQSASETVALAHPSDDPIEITQAAHRVLGRLHPGAAYVRAGVVLNGLQFRSQYLPLELFATEQPRLGLALDQVTGKFGGSALGLGLAGFAHDPAWSMRRGMLSNRATTVWGELPQVQAS